MEDFHLARNAETGNPLNAALGKAIARVATLEGELSDALMTGEDTGPVRDFLQEAQEEVLQARHAVAAAELAAEQEQQAAIELRASSIAAESVTRAADLAQLNLPSFAFLKDPLMQPNDSIAPHHADAIRSHAAALATAEAKLERTGGRLRQAEHHSSTVHTRIAEKQAARAAITARRAAGQENPNDGPDLALLAADLENLASELSKAEAIVAEHRPAHQEAKRVMLVAQQMLSEAERVARQDLLIEHARALDAGLLTVVKQINALGSGVHASRPKWNSSRELREALRTLAIRVGDFGY